MSGVRCGCRKWGPTLRGVGGELVKLASDVFHSLPWVCLSRRICLMEEHVLFKLSVASFPFSVTLRVTERDSPPLFLLPPPLRRKGPQVAGAAFTPTLARAAPLLRREARAEGGGRPGALHTDRAASVPARSRPLHAFVLPSCVRCPFSDIPSVTEMPNPRVRAPRHDAGGSRPLAECQTHPPKNCKAHPRALPPVRGWGGSDHHFESVPGSK